jgi:hypothetical protein
MRAETTAEKLFFATARIDADLSSAQASKAGSGTAFVLRHRAGRHTHEFLVTDRHVVTPARRLVAHFHRADPIRDDVPALTDVLHYTFEPDRAGTFWQLHPDADVDLALTPLAPIRAALEREGTQLFYRAIDSNLAPIEADLAQCDALEDVVFIGYPNGVWDRAHHLPAARRGITATPIAVDFEGRPRFLIDAAVFGGSSGSPVFIYNRSGWTARDGALRDGQRLLFAGVVGAVYYRSAVNDVVSLPAARPSHSGRHIVRDREMLDLGIVHKARAVIELAQLAATQSPA